MLAEWIGSINQAFSEMVTAPHSSAQNTEQRAFTIMSDTQPPAQVSTSAPAPSAALDSVTADAPPALPASFQKFINQAETVRLPCPLDSSRH